MTHDLPKNSNIKSIADSTKEISISSMESPLPIDPKSIPTSDLQESYHRLVLLYDLCRQIYAETETERVFDKILSTVISTLNVERAFIAILSEDRLIPRACYHIELSEDFTVWPVSSTMINRVLNEGISIRTTDAIHDEQYGTAASVDFHSIRSVMCCPIGYNIETKGLIYVDNRICVGAFSRSDLEFLNALSHYAVLAIKNAEERFYLTEQKELAEARLDVLRSEMVEDHNIVGLSKRMVELYGRAKKVAKKNVAVLIQGETGSGKEVLARFTHACSPRAGEAFIAVNIGALPSTLVESELFGHEKGAFTGADKKRVGRFELAQGGTLFLDEVQDIPIEVQPKLLRFLEQHSFERLGSNKMLRTDVRIICASNRNLENCVTEGTFREDLFYRLNSVALAIPPLRERREDVVPLINYFLQQCGSTKVFDKAALNCLMNFSWPGNVRELKNCIEGIDALVEGPLVYANDLPERMRKGRILSGKHSRFELLAELVARVEKEHILRAIDLAEGNSEAAIKLLGISRSKFFQRKKEYGFR